MYSLIPLHLQFASLSSHQLLEKFLSGHYATFFLFTENFPGGGQVLSHELESPMLLDLTSNEARILFNYQDKASRFGLLLESHHDDVGQLKLSTKFVPKCFKNREESDKYFKRPSSLEGLINDLAKELVQTWSQTKGSLNLLPKTISNVLNSQACRGE